MKLWGKKDADTFNYGLLGADMHSHIIPGIDDGSPDLETSIKLIEGLTELGFKKLITTPHIMQDMYLNKRDDILDPQKILYSFRGKHIVPDVQSPTDSFAFAFQKAIL